MRNRLLPDQSVYYRFLAFISLALWSAPSPALSLDDLSRIHDIGVTAERNGKLYLATSSGLFLAGADGGVKKISTDANALMSLAIHTAESTVLFASGYSQTGNLGVVASYDRGSSWKPLSAGAGGLVNFRTLAISPSEPRVMYGQSQLLQTSRDGGKNWNQVARVPSDVYKLAVSARDPKIVYAATQSGLLMSTDGGVQWRALHTDSYPATMVHVASDGTVHAFVLGMGLIRAKEPELNWKTVYNQFGQQALMSFAVDQKDSNRLFALNQFNRVLETVDDGKTWNALGGDRVPVSESARRGEQLYRTHCMACHGLRGVGENHSARTLRDRRYIRAPALDDSTHAWHHSDDNLVKTILEGSSREPRMRAFKDVLTRETALDLVAYMKSLWGPRALDCQGPRHMDKECQPPR